MDRRCFVLAALASGALGPTTRIHAQQSQKVRRIGVMSAVTSGSPVQQRVQKGLLDGLRRLGYEEGRNLGIEWRFSGGKERTLLALAEDLVHLKVELIVAHLEEAIVAARQATRTIPIVMYTAAHPVENGWIESLARPGGNVTGTLWTGVEQAAKALELLKEAAPRAVRIAIMSNPTYPFAKMWYAEYDRAARALGMVLQYVDVTRPEEVNTALDRIAAARPDALFVSAERILLSRMPDIAAFAIDRKLVSVSNVPGWVRDGGLLYHGPHFASIADRTASYVDRILRGVKPADLPVELPTKFELLINAKTARAIGYRIPQSLLLRADRVIE